MAEKKELNTEAMENVAGGVDVGGLIKKGVEIADTLLNGGKKSGDNGGGGTPINQTNNNTNSNQQNNVSGGNTQHDVVLKNN